MGAKEPGEGLEGHQHTVGTGGFSASSWAVLTTLGFVFSRAFRKRSERGAGRPCGTSWTASTSRWRCGSCSSCRAGPSRYPAAAAGLSPARGAHRPRCWDCVFPRSAGAFAALLETFLRLKETSLVQQPPSPSAREQAGEAAGCASLARQGPAVQRRVCELGGLSSWHVPPWLGSSIRCAWPSKAPSLPEAAPFCLRGRSGAASAPAAVRGRFKGCLVALGRRRWGTGALWGDLHVVFRESPGQGPHPSSKWVPWVGACPPATSRFRVRTRGAAGAHAG